MNTSVAQRLATIRGGLSAEEPGARGLERVARNPACQRLRALTMAGITPATAMEAVYGQTAPEGQSPFALSIGNRFEADLFDSGAAKILDLYRNAGRLTPQECKVAVIPDLAPASMALRRTETLKLFRLKLQRHPAAPNVIVKPRIQVPLLSIEHDIEPDVLVASDTEAFYRPAEVKSYPDRDGKTDAADVRSACRQAAVAVLGLRYALSTLSHPNPSSLVPPEADLILRAPNAFRATLSAMSLQGEVHSLERALNEAPRDLAELEALLALIAPAASLDDPSVLDAIPTNYLPSCREHCALARRCKQQAISCGDPALLGTRAREELSSAGSIDRALALLHGAPPATPEEATLAQRLRMAHAELRMAV